MWIVSSSFSTAWRRVVAVLASVALVTAALASVAPLASAVVFEPTLVSDKADYPPGATVTLATGA